MDTDRIAEVVKNIRENFPKSGELDRQALCVAEEAGEFVSAYRRWSGQARRRSTRQSMIYELADLVIASYVMANLLDVNLDSFVNVKLDEIFKREWKESEQ